jgi:hypothetical protein
MAEAPTIPPGRTVGDTPFATRSPSPLGLLRTATGLRARAGGAVRHPEAADPAQHFIDHVLPQLEKLRSTATVEEIRAVAPTAGYGRPIKGESEGR